MWRGWARIVVITLALGLAGVAGAATVNLANGGPRSPLRIQGPPQPPRPIAISPAPNPSPSRAASPLALTLASPSVPVPSPSPATFLVWDETFATNRLGWPNDPDSTAWLAPDGYHLAIRQPGRFVAVAPAERLMLRAVQVTATFRKVAGLVGGSYGIIVHDQGPGPRDGQDQSGRYDVLEARDTGEVAIWRREGDHRVDLIPWQAAPTMRVGTQENRLLVRANGPELLLLVNGVEAARSRDPTLESGSVGVFVGGEANEAVLTRLLVEALTT